MSSEIGSPTPTPGRRTLTESLAQMPQIRRQVDPSLVGPEAAGDAAADGATARQTPGDPERELESIIGDVGADDPGGGDPPREAEVQPNALDQAVSCSVGRPLPDVLRMSLESTAGRALSSVRIHDDDAAGRAAIAIGARAFTLKQNIYFAPGSFDPSSAEGRRLIAHEVGHTLQAEGAMGGGVTTASDPVEQEAEAFADVAEKAPHAGATPADTGGPATYATATQRNKVPRFPAVVPEAFAHDKVRWIDEADHSQGKVWQDDRGYVKNPTATKLSTITTSKGKIGGEFSNGKYMYVVDGDGDVWVGKRMGKNMPHPTLIGGKDPHVQAAGMVDIEGGKIVKIDNHSGHFRPPRGAMSNAVKSFLKLPKAVFEKAFRAESVHFNAAGDETRKPFKSLRMLKLKSFTPKKSLNRIRMRYKHDPKFKGKVNSGLKSAGKAGLAIIATLIVQYFIGKWLAEMEAERARKAIDALAPEVEAALLASLEAQVDELDALNEADPETKLHFNIVYRLSWIETFATGPYGEDMGSEGFTGAELVSAGIAPTPVKEDFRFYEMTACIGSATKYYTLSMSEEIRVGDLYGDDEPTAATPDKPGGDGK